MRITRFNYINKYMSKFTKIIDVSFGIIALLLMILSIVTYVKLNTSDYTYLNNVGVNWKNGPIISVNTDTLTCANDEVNLLDDEWGGTTEGCYCPHSFDLFYGNLRDGSCRDERDSLLFCSNVRATPPIKYTTWRGRQLCGKRMRKNYFDLVTANNAQGCPMNHKPCGVIDTLNNVLCVEKNENCPFNDIKVIPSIDSIPKDRNYTVLKANSVNFLFSNENIKGNVITQFKVSDNQPCILPYYENMSGKLYLLDAMKSRDKCSRGIGDTIIDNEYVKLDTYNKKNFFMDNQLIGSLSSLPEFNIEDYNTPTSLFVKEYIGVNPSCIRELKQSGLTGAAIEELSNVESKMGTSLGFAMAIMIIVIISLFFAIAYVVISFSGEISTKLIISCCPMTMNIVNFILGLVLMSKIKEFNTYFDLLTDSRCVDGVTLTAFDNFESKINGAKGTNMAVIIFSFISFLTPIASFIIEKYF